MGDSNNAAPEMDESHEDTSRSSQSAKEGSLNKAIFSINENMAKMAAIFENMCDTKGPPAKKRKARGEDSMSASDPESEEEAGPSTSHHMDDNVSLYASDELEDDDAVKVLTERNKNPKKVTDQKSSKGKMLNSLADAYDTEDATGDDLDEDVTTLVKKRRGKKLNPDKIKTIVEKHKRPANCPKLKQIKVNQEIWAQLKCPPAES